MLTLRSTRRATTSAAGMAERASSGTRSRAASATPLSLIVHRRTGTDINSTNSNRTSNTCRNIRCSSRCYSGDGGDNALRCGGRSYSCTSAARAAAAATSSSSSSSPTDSNEALAPSPSSEKASDATETDSQAPSTTTASFPLFHYQARLFYAPFFRSRALTDFMLAGSSGTAIGSDHHSYVATSDQVTAMATTYRHVRHRDIIVTLVPLSHAAHPHFFYQVDLLLCQHDSVLMEGRVPFTGAPHSTLVPPRPLPNQLRPVDQEDDVHSTPSGSDGFSTGGWEPNDMTAYWQPFSWGVKDSANYTVIHAADKYDYERLPWYASLRFNMPLLGSFAREKHCLNMIPPLVANGYRKFAIPWGAAHMPIFHEMLERNGFVMVSASGLTVFNGADGPISRGFIKSTSKRFRTREDRNELLMICACVLLVALIIKWEAKVDISGASLQDYVEAGRERDRAS